MIRAIERNDCGAILDIYAHYINKTSYTFETEVPALCDFEKRLMDIASEFPFFVYVSDGEILGYAYASHHNKRHAYRFGVDISIYISHDHLGKGIGTALYDKMFEMLKNCGYYNVFACITFPNEPSVSMHKKYRFEEVGRLKNAGYKFGKWHDVIWMQKEINPPTKTPKEPNREW